MKKTTLILIFAAIFSLTSFGQGYKIGDKATDFSLKNVDGKMVSMASLKNTKGFIVIFTCNRCPYSIAYEDRIIDLDKKYANQGFPVIAINPNDPVAYPDDAFDKMIIRAKEKGFTFPYLVDESQNIAKSYGASRTPHVFVLNKVGKDLIVSYIGAIDDNSENAGEVKEKYIENAVDNLLAGKAIATTQTKAIGCGIKWKK